MVIVVLMIVARGADIFWSLDHVASHRCGAMSGVTNISGILSALVLEFWNGTVFRLPSEVLEAGLLVCGRSLKLEWDRISITM